MKFEKIDCGNGTIAIVSSDSMVISDVDSALDLQIGRASCRERVLRLV